MPVRLRRFVTQDERAPATLLCSVFVLVLGFLHWWQLPVTTFAHDLPTHMKYMRYIANTLSVPKPTAYWGFYHPPLYYIFGAGVLKAGQLLTGALQWKAVSALSLLCYGVYVFFAARLLLMRLSDTRAYAFAFALICFWPLGIHMARAINNDVPLFMTQTATLYYLLRWWDGARPTHLIKTLLWNAVSIAVKSNGLVMSGVILAVVLLRWYRTQKKPDVGTSRFCRFGLFAALVLALLPLGRSFYYYEVENIASPPVFFAAGLSQPPANNVPGERNPYLGNEAWHFISFDLDNYLTYPFYTVRRDEGGRQYFWNAVLKTALFDEYHWKDVGGARVLGVTFLLLILYTVGTGISTLRQPTLDHAPLLIAIVCQLMALLALRLLFPADWHQEYRFIYAVTVPLCLTFGLALQRHYARGNRVAAMFGCILATLFSLQAFVFILRQHIP